MLDGYIYNALRTPFARHAGALARMRPDDMLAAVISEVVKQSPFDAEKIEDVQWTPVFDPAEAERHSSLSRGDIDA